MGCGDSCSLFYQLFELTGRVSQNSILKGFTNSWCRVLPCGSGGLWSFSHVFFPAQPFCGFLSPALDVWTETCFLLELFFLHPNTLDGAFLELLSFAEVDKCPVRCSSVEIDGALCGDFLVLASLECAGTMKKFMVWRGWSWTACVQ